jgi:recombination protein RecT
MAQLVRLDERSKIIVQLFDANRKRMIAGTPKSSGDPNRLFQVAFNQIAYDPKLLECSQASLIGGVFEALKLGLTIGGPMQEAWLIPFKEKGIPTATLIVGYMGYRNIIDRAGAVIDMHPRNVHVREAEEKLFDWWFGDQPRIIHKPRYPVLQEKELYATYCVANLRRGGRQLEVMLKDEIDAHRARSRAKDSGPWVTDYCAMALKTSIRKISKYLPKSNELLRRALDLDERADLGQDQQFELPPEVSFIDAPDAPSSAKVPANPMDRLKERIGISAPRVQADPPQEITDELRAEIARQDRELAEREGQGQ